MRRFWQLHLWLLGASRSWMQGNYTVLPQWTSWKCWMRHEWRSIFLKQLCLGVTHFLDSYAENYVSSWGFRCSNRFSVNDFLITNLLILHNRYQTTWFEIGFGSRLQSYILLVQFQSEFEQLKTSAWMVVSVIFPILSSEFSRYNLIVYLGEHISIPAESMAENPRFLGVWQFWISVFCNSIVVLPILQSECF